MINHEEHEENRKNNKRFILYLGRHRNFNDEIASPLARNDKQKQWCHCEGVSPKQSMF